MLTKKGNIQILSITMFFIILIIFLSIYYIFWAQINYYIYPIKKDLFYIVQNSLISFVKKELEYYNYVLDGADLNKKLKTIIEKNYGNKVTLGDLYYNYNDNCIYIGVKIKVKTLIFNKNFILVVKDKIKVKMMEVI